MGSKNKKANKKDAGDSFGAGENHNGKNKDKKMIDDPRFSRVHSDPRFQKVPKRTSKVAIDSRFNEMFTDKRFASSSAKVDKRGKAKKQSENALLRYYHLEEDNKEVEDEAKKKKSVKNVEEESEGNSSESLASESSGDSSESESEPGLESDDDLSSTTGSDDDADTSGDESSDVENVPLIEQETHRLAIVNMDWNQVKAVDLLVVLKSFLPKEGVIKSIAVYPSEFGLKRMEEEAVRGPVALLEDDKKKDDEGVDDDEEDDDEEEDDEEEDDDDDNEIGPGKLRAYERSRLRYYYAVVECDSIATADYLYKACDGVEFERSSNVLDLRFIPDSMEFPHPPREVAKEAPADYEGLDFHTRALQQSNITLSWDDDEPHRVKKLGRKFNDDQLAELELKEFLASDESDSDEDEDLGENEESEDDGDPAHQGKKQAGKIKARMAKKDMYRALLQSGDGSEEDEGHNMEVTFNTGLEDLSKKILEKKDKGSETLWDAFLSKRKERKKSRKHRSKNSSDDETDESDQEPVEQPDDFFEEEPSVLRSKKVTNDKEKREKKPLEDDEKAATAAELELLLADEKGADNNIKGYKIKQKKDKGKKVKEASGEDKLPTVDYDDPRFSALFTNPGFALDPTDPQFKRSATYFRQLVQRQQSDKEEPVETSRPSLIDSARKEDEKSVTTSRKEKFELASIVKSIKMKSQQLPKPSSVKMIKDKVENGSNMKEKKHKLEGLDRKMKKKAKV